MIRSGSIKPLGESRKIVTDIAQARDAIAEMLAEAARRTAQGRAQARDVARAEEIGRFTDTEAAQPVEHGPETPLKFDRAEGSVVSTPEGRMPMMSAPWSVERLNKIPVRAPVVGAKTRKVRYQVERGGDALMRVREQLKQARRLRACLTS